MKYFANENQSQILVTKTLMVMAAQCLKLTPVDLLDF